MASNSDKDQLMENNASYGACSLPATEKKEKKKEQQVQQQQQQQNGTEKNYQNRRLALVLVVLVIEVVLFTKLCLILTKYAIFINTACYPNVTGNITPTEAPDDKQAQTLTIIHVLVNIFVAVIGLLNMLEYLQLGWGTWKYFHDMEQHPLSLPAAPNFSRKCKLKCSIFWIASLLILFPIGKFAVGVLMEMQISGCIEENSSSGFVARVYIAFSTFELLNATVFACSVRVLLVWQTYKIRIVWFENMRKAPKKKPESSELSQVVQDAWFDEKEDYERRGKQVKRMMTPFKYWFLTPWIMFTLMTFINPRMLLSPWNKVGEEKLLSISQVYYVLLVILKALQLFTQNVCTVEMNIYHRKYFRKMVRRFQKGFTDETEKNNTRMYQMEAKNFKLHLNDRFNFYPNLMCIDSKINISSPYYVLGLALGVFITAFNKF